MIEKYKYYTKTNRLFPFGDTLLIRIKINYFYSKESVLKNSINTLIFQNNLGIYQGGK